MQEARTDSDIFPTNKSEEAERGRLEEAEETARLSKMNNEVTTDHERRRG